MSLMTAFLSTPPDKTQTQTPSTSSITKPRKIKLSSSQTEESMDDLDTALMIKAINNSFTQRMSGDKVFLDPTDIISIISEFALSQYVHTKVEDMSSRMWCVVQVDQKYLQNSGIGRFVQGMSSVLNCSHHSTKEERSEYNIINHIELPSTIKPYCLTMNMGCKELHFQSHQCSEDHFFINLDTVTVDIALEELVSIPYLVKDLQTAKRQLNRPIQLSMHTKSKPLQIKIYVTQFTLPFPFKQQADEQQKLRYLLHCRQSLYKLLKKSIQQSRGRQLKLSKILQTSLAKRVTFYNNRYATEQQFIRYCQSGDILLFRDNHTMAKVQRTLTGSPYDHVGIVYRSEQFGLCLFESNSGLGVGLASWRKLIRNRWFENIQKIAWRKLLMHDKPADLDKKIDQFVKGNLHKQFGLSLPKLLKFKSVTYTKDSNKSYFCSELAAELYRYLGILDVEKSSTQYWPKDFADGNGIQILNGALDFERQLIFDTELLKVSYPDFK